MSRNTRRRPELAVAKAMELQRAGRLDDAEATLRDTLAKNPTYGDALHLLGLLHHARGDMPGAVALVERAAEASPAAPDTWRNLGTLRAETGDLRRAEACFRRVLALRAGDTAARGNLALVLERQGRPDEAASELRALVAARPNDVGALNLLAKLLRVTKRHEEEVTVARRIVDLCPSDPAARRALSRSYFLWFDSVDSDPERAQRVLAEWTAFDPDDPVARHMLAAHSGRETPARASDGYVERHFDEFAPTFDAVLAGLDYRGVALVEQALGAVDGEPRARLAVADLGCGTGACGPLVRPWARALVGVDLSSKMLDQARARGVYDQLVHREITAFLADQRAAFDLVVCADTLVYVGDTGPLFTALAHALRPGGRFIATTESHPDPDTPFQLIAAGRYKHGVARLRTDLEAVGMQIERCATGDLRREFDAIVPCVVVTATRPETRAR
jgi:predicted TPR repeat methyltransferase